MDIGLHAQKPRKASVTVMSSEHGAASIGHRSQTIKNATNTSKKRYLSPKKRYDHKTSFKKNAMIDLGQTGKTDTKPSFRHFEGKPGFP